MNTVQFFNHLFGAKVAVPPTTFPESLGPVGADERGVIRLIPLLDASGATCFFGQACFAAGTPLRTPGGWAAIEDLRPGDLVLSRDEHDPSGAAEAKVVEAVFRRTAALWTLRLGGREIGTTAEHPFYVIGRGWTRVDQLAIGDLLGVEDGTPVAVEAAWDTGDWVAVYNLRVADHHTYFVGTPEWGFAAWAHNTEGLCAPPPGALSAAQLVGIRTELRNGARIVLRSDTTYTVTTFGQAATFTTDGKGRLATVNFNITTLRPGDRLANPNDTSQIGHLGVDGDVGFHIIGDQFCGSNYYPNLVPGNGDLNKYNSGAYGKLEALWKTALGNGKNVTNVVVGLDYPNPVTTDRDNLRPAQFTVAFTVDGQRFRVALPNQSGVSIDPTVLAAITQAVS